VSLSRPRLLPMFTCRCYQKDNISTSGMIGKVIHFEQTAQEHPDIMKSGKQTSRTGRLSATGLDACSSDAVASGSEAGAVCRNGHGREPCRESS